jgi:hypothetical protein
MLRRSAVAGNLREHDNGSSKTNRAGSLGLAELNQTCGSRLQRNLREHGSELQSKSREPISVGLPTANGANGSELRSKSRELGLVEEL